MGRSYTLVVVKIIMKKIFKKNSYGFTLIEMLVVLFIISLLSVLILANYHGNKEKYVLLQVNQKLISDLRKVQNMAISGTEIEGHCSASDLCYGYGIYFNSGNSYILFADNNNNKIYNSGEGFETVNLPDSIVIQSTTPSPVSVFFIPPNPITYINRSNIAGISAKIILRIQGAGSTKTVKINTAGLIENDND